MSVLVIRFFPSLPVKTNKIRSLVIDQYEGISHKNYLLTNSDVATLIIIKSCTNFIKLTNFYFIC